MHYWNQEKKECLFWETVGVNMKKCFIILCATISLFYLYKNLHPKIKYIYHENGIKTSIKVLNDDGSTEYLRPFFSNSVTYYFPLKWQNISDGITFISKHSRDMFLENDIDFCTMEVYLDEDQKVSDVKKYGGICIKP